MRSKIPKIEASIVYSKKFEPKINYEVNQSDAISLLLI